jgi:branched-chain amino acid transport system ATP-binding protein
MDPFMLLSTRGLSVRYGGVHALKNVDLTVEPGSFVGLIGPNGAGKTTLIDALSGFTRAQGTVEFAGREIQSLNAHRRARRGLARTFQTVEMFDDLTIRENVLVTAERAGPIRSALNLLTPTKPGPLQVVDGTLELLGLADIGSLYPTEISLGRRKLVSVARALASRPRLLLLDEPAAGLDSDESLEFGTVLQKIVETGVSILIVDHDMGLVLRVCQHIYVLDFGELIAQGTPEQIAQDPEVVRAYLGGDIPTERSGAAK